MKKPLLIPVALIVLAGTLATCGGSDDGKLQISDAWSRTPAVTQENGAVYMTIQSPVDVQLIKVGVPASIAGKAELHGTVASGSGGDSVMSMRPASALDLPAGQDVVLEPGGSHVMLLKLAKPLQSGETFPLTLTLEKAGEVQVDATVREN